MIILKNLTPKECHEFKKRVGCGQGNKTITVVYNGIKIHIDNCMTDMIPGMYLATGPQALIPEHKHECPVTREIQDYIINAI